jgi:hypothetical protein
MLRAEGIAEKDLSDHPDWQVWLLDTRRVQPIIATFLAREAVA